MKPLFSDISLATLNIVFPIYCQGCGIKLSYDNKRYLCHDCRKRICLNPPPFCIRCGKPLAGDRDIRALCADCVYAEYHFQAAWQCCRYEGVVKDLIHKFKFEKKTFLKTVLAEIMYEFVLKYIDYKIIDFVLPVPMHSACLHARGFNQASLLATELSRLLKIPAAEGCLLKMKKTAQQISLDKKKRLTNIKGAFSAREPAAIKGKRLLLVDDVFTTGATLNECSRALTVAGAERVWALALARGAT